MTEPSTAESTRTGGITAPELRGRVHQTLHLAEGTGEVQALLTVDATQSPVVAATEAPEAAEVIILDASTSMLHPEQKARAAVDAAVAAIEVMRDGVLFAVLAGTDRTRLIWPPEGGLQRAGADTRAAATAALRAGKVGGGTRIGHWLRTAADLVADHPGAIRHAILLTDGNDEFETRAELDEAIESARDMLTCDCRGIGDDWYFEELHAISRAMHGSVGRVAEPAGLSEDFRAMMVASMRKEVAQVALRLWTPVGARITLVEQSAPEAVDLTGRRTDVEPQVGLYPTGSWGPEQRDFHIAIEVPPADPGRTRLVARVTFVSVAADGSVHPLEQRYTRHKPDGEQETRTDAVISATWTSDPGVDTGRAEQVLRADTEARIAEKVRTAMAALDDGLDEEAESLLRVARSWADEIGDAAMVRQIDGLFDPETDTFRAGGVTRGEQHELEIETTRRRVQRRSPE